MGKMVIDLQRDCLNPNVPAEYLLRKALAMSSKLGVSEIVRWLQCELNGYGPGEIVPAYRRVRGIIKARDPYRGWEPVQFESEEMLNETSTQDNRQPIAEITALSAATDLRSKVSHELKMALLRDYPGITDVEMFVSPTSLVGIIDTVRNMVLQWALELESKGVLGEDMSFSEDGQSRGKSQNYSIFNVIGTMRNSQLQQMSDSSTQELTFGALDDVRAKAKELLVDADLAPDTSAELKAAIDTVEVQRLSKRPKQPIIRGCLKSIRSVAEGVAGSAVATALLSMLTNH